MRTLLLLRGSPGCGKSTWVQAQGLKPYTLCADDIRMLCSSPILNAQGKEEISQSNDATVWSTLFKILELRMQNGEFTVIDATNSKTSEMNRYMKRKGLSDLIAGYIRNNTTPSLPITGRVIAKEFNISDADVRKHINTARCQGIPICSSRNGYYYSDDPSHVQRTIDSIQGRISAQLNAINGLRTPNQM